MEHQEVWIDKLRYNGVKLVKMTERGKMSINNNIFERGQKNFFKRIGDGTEDEGVIPEIDKFVKFGGCMQEKDDCTSNMSQMENILEELKEKIARKNLTSLGMD